jgi:hypothetical protein
MPAPEAIVSYGNFAIPLLTAESYRRRRDGLDDGIFTLIDNNPDSFPPNSSYNGFLILDDNPTRIGDVWEHQLNAIGIRGSKPSRMVKRTISASLEGFDSATETWLTNNRNTVIVGSRMQGYNNMVCENPSVEELEFSGWFRIQANYRGIAVNKPVKRTISSNVDISVVDDLIWLAPGGDNSTAHKWAIAIPKVTCTFSYVGSGINIKPMPNQGGTPAGNLPTIQPSPWFNIAEDKVTYNWPSGWRLVSMPQEEIPGTNISLTQEVWEYQFRQTV